MLKIGDFSRLSRVSVRMLRYYDDVGLIKPTKVDDLTGYRFYNENQLPQMSKINALKDMGFSISMIKDILQYEDNVIEIEKVFKIHRKQLLEDIEKLNYQIKLLDIALGKLRKDEVMKYNCVIKEMPERYVASVRQTISKYEDEGKLWHILFKETSHLNMIPCGSAMAILHDKEFKENDVDVEVQIEVKGKYPDTQNVKFKMINSLLVASTSFNGSYDQFRDAYAALAAWVFENGYEFCGAMIDIYHVGPNETRNPDEFVTEICCPIKKKVY